MTVRKLISILVICAAGLAFAACAGNQANTVSAENDTAAPSKTVNVRATTGFKTGAGAGVVKVDGRSIGTFGPNRSVPVGTHTLTVSFGGSRGLFKGAIEGEATVRATLQPGRSYRSVAVAKDDKVSVWIEDEKSGQRVSNVAHPDVKLSPIEIPIIVTN